MEISPYFKPDGTYMTADEIRADIKKRADRIMDIINDISEVQEEIDKQTGDVYSDEQLTTLTWYSVMMRDWAKRANAITGTARVVIDRALSDPKLVQIIDLLTTFESAEDYNTNPSYGGIKLTLS